MISFEEVSRHGRGRYLKVKLTTKIGKHDFERQRADNRTLVVTIGRIEEKKNQSSQEGPPPRVAPAKKASEGAEKVARHQLS